MDILASDTFGRPVKLVHQKIYQVLIHPCEGIAHVYAHHPKMVIIYRSRDNNIWSIVVEEFYDDGIDDTPLISIYKVTFKDEEIDTAIKLFLTLVKSQRKDFIQDAYKKLGKCVILSNIPRGIPINCRNVQKYLYETFRDSVKRSLSGRRSRQTISRKGSRDNKTID